MNSTASRNEVPATLQINSLVVSVYHFLRAQPINVHFRSAWNSPRILRWKPVHLSTCIILHITRSFFWKAHIFYNDSRHIVYTYDTTYIDTFFGNARDGRLLGCGSCPNGHGRLKRAGCWCIQWQWRWVDPIPLGVRVDQWDRAESFPCFFQCFSLDSRVIHGDSWWLTGSYMTLWWFDWILCGFMGSNQCHCRGVVINCKADRMNSLSICALVSWW